VLPQPVHRDGPVPSMHPSWANAQPDGHPASIADTLLSGRRRGPGIRAEKAECLLFGRRARFGGACEPGKWAHGSEERGTMRRQRSTTRRSAHAQKGSRRDARAPGAREGVTVFDAHVVRRGRHLGPAAMGRTSPRGLPAKIAGRPCPASRPAAVGTWSPCSAEWPTRATATAGKADGATKTPPSSHLRHSAGGVRQEGGQRRQETPLDFPSSYPGVLQDS